MPKYGLLALRADPPAVDPHVAGAVAREVYGIAAGVTPLEGERDRNFRLDAADGRRFVLKFIDHEADDVVVAGQSAVLDHLAEQNSWAPVSPAAVSQISIPRISVPRVVPTQSGTDIAVIDLRRYAASAGPPTCRVRLVTYLPGRPIERASDVLLRSVGCQIGALDRGLRGFFHPALGQPIAWDVRRASALLSELPGVKSPTARRLVADAVEPVQSLLPRLRGLRSQAIHGDCHGRNLLGNDQGTECVGVIDLGDMIHAPLVLEMAVTAAELLVDGVASLDGVSRLLAGYASVQPLERDEIDVLYELMAARIGVTVLIQAWRAGNGMGALTRELEDASAAALDSLATRGKAQLTRAWVEASASAADNSGACEPLPAAVNAGARGPLPVAANAGTRGPQPAAAVHTADRRPAGALLQRRHAALGANAELSYDRPLHLVCGEGVWVYAADGERLLDVYNNVPHVGHAHPVVVEAIAEQARRIASNTRYLDERIIEYVERLTATLPSDLDTCLFVNSGSEANDVAWRIAKAHTGHGGALVMKFAYHGITDAVTALSPAIATTAAAHVEQLAAPVRALTGPRSAQAASAAADSAPSDHADGRRADRAQAASAEADIANAIERLAARGFGLAALMIDSALTSTGIYDPPPSWVEPIATAGRNTGALIIADEVQFGLGRSGTDFWGFKRRGYHPDIVTLGKPVGNGYPMGVVVTRRAILEKFQRDTGFFSTFGGNPVAGAAGLAVLDVLEREKLLENARTTGDYFIGKLRELAPKYDNIKDVRGRGLMIGVEVTDRALTKQLVNGLRNRGVLIGSEGPLGNVLKLRPPMPFRPEHADIVVNALTEALSAVRS